MSTHILDTQRKKNNIAVRVFLAAAIISLTMLPSRIFAQGTNDVTEDLSISAVVGDQPAGTVSGSHRGVGYTAPTVINFSGRAYPLSTVTVLMDGRIAMTTIAGTDARFTVSLLNLSAGNGMFAVYAQDYSTRLSAVYSFPLYITYGATTDVANIFLAPTIDTDKSEVRQGDAITIYGVAAPLSTVTISLKSMSEQFVTSQADANGVYTYNFKTANSTLGLQRAVSKASLPPLSSPYGRSTDFLVSEKSISKGLTCSGRSDLNHDCKVDLSDFSVLAYWHKRAGVPTSVDLNGDGKVSLADFSILAYFWTGS